MKRKGKQMILRKGALVTMLITASVLGDAGNAASAQEPAPDFTLEQMIVTAQRYEKRDVDTAASADIYTAADLQNTGAVNLYEALKYTTGIEIQAYGSAGGSMGNMTSKLSIRGAGSGTLVLINGMPLNIRGTYDLNDIPVENVERVEVIRGGGSVLYGSEATGGVINIITKTERKNYVKTSFGNFGQEDHSISLQEGKLGVGYQYSRWGTREKAASDGKIWKGPENDNISLSYRFDDKLSLSYNRVESDYHYITNTTDTKQDVERNNVQISYADKDLKATLYYVDRTRIKNAVTIKNGKASLSSDKEQNDNLGVDIQKDWTIGDAKLLFGGSYQDEHYTPNGEREQTRNNFSTYAQYEKPLSELNTVIVSARESWTTGAPQDYNTTNFSGQGQFIHKLGDNENLYVNIGQSYKMPYLHQIKKGVEFLKPQTGMHYEVGWKKNTEDHRWRVALFNYTIDDNITATYSEKTGDFTYTNEDLKNTGIELSCDIAGKNGWTYNWGVSYSDPRKRTFTNGVLADDWVRDYARLQLTGGTTYQHDKWRAALNATYQAERATTGKDVKPYLLTNLNVNYSLTPNSDIFLSVSNILDRDDVMYSSGSTDYYAAPCNFFLGYKLGF